MAGGKFWLGTSGWGYPEWVGPFYPPGTKEEEMLRIASRVFNTLEINTSFYHVPRVSTVKRWADQVPDGFVFSAKVPRVVTHKKKLGDVGKLTETYLGVMSHLGEHLGPLLIQLPPKLGRDENLLESYLNQLPSGYRYAVEFRNPSWLEPGVFKLLERYGVAYCIVDEPLLPFRVEITADIAYVRFHGHGKRPWYNYNYSDEELRDRSKKLLEITGSTSETFAYFNNHFRGRAALNALTMLEIMGLGARRPEQVVPAQSQLTRWIR